MTKRERSWPAEFELALQCCKAAFRTSSPESPTIPAGMSWRRFFEYTAFHRVEGFAATALTSPAIPAEMRSSLAEQCARIAARNLEVTAACRHLQRTFEDAEVPLLFLKGLTLGALAYRNPMTKRAIDIDLLIDPDDLCAAARLLRDCGYRLVTPQSSSNDALQRWHRMSKESVWLNQEQAIQLDLHTSASDNPRLIPRISVHSPRQVVDIGNGVVLATLAPNELFAYLAVHGASSAWFRLKWISDFAGLLHGCHSEEIDGLFSRSQELGAGRAAGQALLLADALFGSLELNADLRRRLAEDQVTRRLCSLALHLLTREPTEPTERFLGTLPHRMSQFAMLSGVRFKLTEFASQARRALLART